MIPKIIHFCWFGGSKKSAVIESCMQSWHKFLPDYEIKEWNENNFPLLQSNTYVREAYTAKKWAFVADVCRLYALSQDGGIYLDTDIEVRKSFDEFLKLDFFMGAEKNGKFHGIGTGVIGAAKGNKIIKDMLDLYNNLHFVKADGSYDLLVNTIRLIPVLLEHGAADFYTETQPIELNKKAKIYPINYFCADTPKSYAVHHFEASWVEDYKLRNAWHLPLGNTYRLSLYRYKKMKKNAAFTYPPSLSAKIFELNYSKKWKLLLEVEKQSYIKDEDITFVVSGLIDNNKQFNCFKAIQSIRKFFPKSPIILSTWTNQDISKLSSLCDKIIINDEKSVGYTDIPCSVDPNCKKINTINLQSVSIFNGLNQVKTKYAIRFRSDFYLKNKNFLKIYCLDIEKYNRRNDRYKIFNQKVLISSFLTSNPEKNKNWYAFETSDCFAFGLTEDLLQRWNGHIEDEKTLSYWSLPTPKTSYYNPRHSNSQYTTEQYGLIRLIRNKLPTIPIPETYCDVSRIDFIENTKHILVNNFFVHSLQSLGLVSKFNKDHRLKKSYTTNDFIKIYYKEFDKKE